MAYKVCILLLLAVCCKQAISADSIEGTCDAKTGQCTPGSSTFNSAPKKPKRYSEPETWQKYLAEIEQAKLVYDEQKSKYDKADCSLYNDVIERDIAPFVEKGVTEELFELMRKQGVHYQIVDKKLYRKKMVFNAHRCAGVEHFLHRIIPNLGNNMTLELIVNDRDLAVSKRWSADAESRLTEHDPLPVFSYWKPFYSEIDEAFIEHQRSVQAINELSGKKDEESVLTTESDAGSSSSAVENSSEESNNVSTGAALKPSPSYYDLLMPSWSFWEGGPIIWPYYPGPQGLGRWDLAREHIEKKIRREYDWSRKVPIGFFRGTRIGKERDNLVRLSAAKPQLVNAEFTKSHNWQSVSDTLGFQPAVEVGLIDHCRYRILFNFDGVGASARLRHLFLCRSLVIAVNAGAKREFFTDALIPWYHYVPVRSNATESELEDLLSFFLAHEALSEQIADNGYRFVREHLDLEDVECYWRRLLRRYASLIRYPVQHDKSLVEIPYGKLVDSTGRG